MIKWFNVKDRNGVASLNINSIVLNTTAMYPFDSAYRVQVGIEDKKIIVKPLTKDVVDSGILDECCLLKLEIHKSFSRISSTQLMNQIADELSIKFDKKPIRFISSWDSVNNYLIIDTSKEAD